MATQTPQVNQPLLKAAKPARGMAVEGLFASWYSKVRTQDPDPALRARKIGDLLPAGSRILEVAPGRGSLSIELARPGQFEVVGLDISDSSVRMAQDQAREQGVSVDFRHGDASEMPLPDETFDFVICRAALKTFTRPIHALREMHRVLKLGGRALIIDLRRDASPEDIRRHIDGLGLSRMMRMLTRWTFKAILAMISYSKKEILRMVSLTRFSKVEVRQDLIGREIWLEK